MASNKHVTALLYIKITNFFATIFVKISKNNDLVLSYLVQDNVSLIIYYDKSTSVKHVTNCDVLMV